MGNNSCGTDGVFILMSHQPVYGGERVSYIGRFPDEKTAKKKKKADGVIEGTAFTRSTINKWNKLGREAMLELDKYLTKQERSAKGKDSKSKAAKNREKTRVEKRKLEEEAAAEEAEREVKRQQRQRIEDLEQSYLREQRKKQEGEEELQRSIDKMNQMQKEILAAYTAQAETPLGSISTQPPLMTGYSNVPTEEAIDLNKSSDLRFIYKGRAGSMPLKTDQEVIMVEHMLKYLEDLPDEIANEDSEKIRESRTYNLESYGATQYWVPAGSSASAANKMSTMRDSHEIVKKLRQKFGGEQCTFSDDSLRYLAAFAATAYGASDEATEMIIAGWTKALFHEVGLHDISARQIANGCPSRTTLKRLELRLAADCLIVRLQEIVDDGATCFALITDHGKRAGMEHFVKLLCWFGKDKLGNDTIKFHCIDVDTSNHSGEDCAKAIKKSLEVFTGRDGVEVIAMTGDAGGGASVQSLLPHMKRLCAVSKDCSKINCGLHALNKCLESSFQDVFGKQGIGHKTPFQLLFVFNQLWKRIKEDGGEKYLEEIYAVTMNELVTNSDWHAEADKKFPHAFGELMQKIEDLENQEDDSGLDELVSLMTERPKNLQDPVFSRWMTVLMCTKVVTANWPIIYFMAVAVKQNEPANSYLWQLSCALLSLMNERSTPGDNSGQTINEFIGSFNDQNTSDTCHMPKKSDTTPTFYVMLLWMQGFAECFFDDMFEWMMRSDPVLGSGSWGQTARLGVERCYVMHMKLKELEDGWENMPQFKPYLDEVSKIPEKGSVSKVGKEFFDKMPGKVFEKFRYVFDKHVTSCWCSDDILHYIIGGNPTLANEFAAWLNHYDSMIGASETLASLGLNEDDVDVEVHEFTDKEITLEHHKVRNGDIKVNVRDCLDYLTADADRAHILERPFVKKYWKHILEMATAEETVDLFDKDTWGDHDYSPLRKAVLSEICIHSIHQQRCENYVQLAALISKTNVGEVRRTARTIIISTIHRIFNKEAMDELARRVADPNQKEKAKKARRVEGRLRIELLIDNLNKFTKKVNRARQVAGVEKCKEIYDRITGKKFKMSETDRKNKINKFKENIKKKRTEVKAEMAAGVDVTPTMDGGVLLRILTKKNSCTACCKDPTRDCDAEHCAMAAVHAEISKREMKMRKGWKKTLEIKEKRHALRDDELQNIALDGDKIKQGYDKTQIRHIIPQSDKMEAMIQLQERLRKKELDIEESL